VLVHALFRFPDPVDEISARLVAAGVVLLSVAYVATGWLPLVAVLAYGFVARVLTGPTLSPLGTLVTRVVRPRVAARPRFVPGPPKRFAQGMGAVISVTALVLALFAPENPAPRAVVGLLIIAAFLESALALCLGCRIFAVLMARGLVPASVCEACADLSRAPVRTRTP
jgi:Domain of unknown function (DUF4395)